MTKALNRISSLSFAAFHSIASNGKKKRKKKRTNVFKDFEFSNSMQMYLSSMIKKRGPSKRKNKGKKKLISLEALYAVHNHGNLIGSMWSY
jgi:hypothetical protein